MLEGEITTLSLKARNELIMVYLIKFSYRSSYSQSSSSIALSKVFLLRRVTCLHRSVVENQIKIKLKIERRCLIFHLKEIMIWSKKKKKKRIDSNKKINDLMSMNHVVQFPSILQRYEQIIILCLDTF